MNVAVKLDNFNIPMIDTELFLNRLNNLFEQEKKEPDRKSGIYIQWRTSVFERDYYTCTECGITNTDLEAHHIKLYSQYIELRFDINNGKTLCIECHKKKHKWRF